MSFVAILLTAFALSMDAFAVSVAKGMVLRKVTISNALKVGLFFGIFQGVMPLLGWLAGISFRGYIQAFDHWIALILLSILGFKMIFESFKDDDEDVSQDTNHLSNKSLTVLAIATSIDALAVGVGFAFLKVDIIPCVLIIALVTLIICFLGVLIGKTIGPLLKNYAELIGGIILILIGISIFNEHTGFITNLIK